MQLATIRNGKLELNSKTMECVRKFPKKTMWVVVDGVARGGKSTLCNLLSKSKTFNVSDEATPCTNGVWISNPVELEKQSGQTNQCREDNRARNEHGKEGNNEEKEYLVVVDSEGTEMGDTTHQHKLLALTCLLACDGGVVIHNDKHYANTAIHTQAFLATGMRLVKGLEQHQLPFLCFLVRNFDSVVTVNKVPATLEQFYDYLLSDTGDNVDADRKLIRGSFPRKKMLTTAPLTKKERSHLDSEAVPPPCLFKADFEKLEKWLFSVLEPKKVGGIVCDGTLLVSFLERTVKAINEGECVEMPNVLEETMDVICGKSANFSVQAYKNGMAIQNNMGELEEKRFQELHGRNLEMALSLYSTSTNGIYKRSAQKFSEITKQNIAQEFSTLKTMHTKLRAEWLAQPRVTDLVYENKLPETKNEALDLNGALKQLEKQFSATWGQATLTKILEENDWSKFVKEYLNFK